MRILQGFIRVYAVLVSPWLGRNCRFHPTCSAYAHQAVGRHGPFKGLLLALGRILKCHPWSAAGWDDPVPDRIAWRDLLGYKRGALKKTADQDAEKQQDVTDFSHDAER